jgi:hypothetical protein
MIIENLSTRKFLATLSYTETAISGERGLTIGFCRANARYCPLLTVAVPSGPSAENPPFNS